MILIDVNVPSVGRIYDFSIDEHSSVSIVIEELVEMIKQKEQVSLLGNLENMHLFDKSTHILLNRSASLNRSGVITGSSLILV